MAQNQNPSNQAQQVQTWKPNSPAGQQKNMLSISKIQEFYLGSLSNALSAANLKMDEEQVACVRTALTTMVGVAAKGGCTVKDIDQANLMTILEQIAILRINLAASPREGYMIIRNQKNGDKWTKVFEFGIEGDGNDKLLRKYGVGVEKVYPFWTVREGDSFTLPAFKGVEITPPTWTPRGFSGKYTHVVYPVKFKDGTVQYFMAEREGVAVNLKAHIVNNIKMDKSRSDADKAAIKDKIDGMTLDEMLADTELLAIMSPAWKDPHSRESMILRKMRNNAIKPIPKDFGDAYVRETYEDTFEDYDQYRQEQKPDPEKVLEGDFQERAGTQEIPAIETVVSIQGATGRQAQQPQPQPQPKPVKQPQQGITQATPADEAQFAGMLEIDEDPF